MIICRSPLRISLGGGGTDLPSYYGEHGGFLVSAAIDKYVYITIHPAFTDQILLKYSKLERADGPAQIEHPIFREAFLMLGIEHGGFEITSLADIPAGTGLGSSGSFTTALLKALHTYQKNIVHPRELAEQACRIELERLGEPIGKQDQYSAAYGGITCFEFAKDGAVAATPLRLGPETLANLETNLLLFFTGFSRSASALLRDQDSRSRGGEREMLDALHFIKELGVRSKAALEEGNLQGFGELMHEHWVSKKRRSGGMSNERIDGWYELARSHGAVGGKLVGAGGGGFLLFYAQDPVRLRRVMTGQGLRELRFRFDFEGTKVVVHA